MFLSVAWAMQECLAFGKTDSNCKYKQLTFLLIKKLHQATCAPVRLFPREHLLLPY